MPNIYDHDFRIKYQNADEREQNKLLTKFLGEYKEKAFRHTTKFWKEIPTETQEDVLQDASIKFDENLKYLPSQEEENLPGLFMAIVRGITIKKMKKNMRGNITSTDESPEIEDKINEVLEALEEILNRLPDSYCRTRLIAWWDMFYENKNLTEKIALGQLNKLIVNSPDEFLEKYNPQNHDIDVPTEKNIDKKNMNCNKLYRKILIDYYKK